MRPKGQIFDLAAFRKRYQVTQKELAERVNRPQSFLSAIEHGKRSAPAALLDELAEAYKVDNITDYLSDREEEVQPNVSHVHNSVVNSPGALWLASQFKDKLSPDDISKIIEYQEAVKRRLDDAVPPATSQLQTVAELVRLLAAAEARCREADNKIKELEAQVKDLQAQLPKRKK